LERGGIAPRIVSSVLHGGELSASCYRCFTAGERTHGNHWVGGRVGPTDDLDAVTKRKISAVNRPPVDQPVAQLPYYAQQIRHCDLYISSSYIVIA